MSAAATVIIPTYGQAPFLRQALASAQRQSVADLEICVICDGSPPEMAADIEEFAKGDERVRVFTFPKSPRTGEPHRHEVLGRTSAPAVCYLCHDDLWFPHHVATMIRSLERFDFVHTLHAETGLGTKRFVPLSFQYADLQSEEYRRAMVDPQHPRNYFGLSCGAHTRKAYERLPEGWATTPEGVWTDLHMWRKFIKAPWCRCGSYLTVTSLHFPKMSWEHQLGPEEYARELQCYLPRLEEPGFLLDLNDAAMKNLLALNSAQSLDVLADLLQSVLNGGGGSATELPGQERTKVQPGLLNQAQALVTNESLQGILQDALQALHAGGAQFFGHQSILARHPAGIALQRFPHPPQPQPEKAARAVISRDGLNQGAWALQTGADLRARPGVSLRPLLQAARLYWPRMSRRSLRPWDQAYLRLKASIQRSGGSPPASRCSWQARYTCKSPCSP